MKSVFPSVSFFLVFLCVLVFSTDCLSQQKVAQHRYVTFHGNKFERAYMPDERGDDSSWVPVRMNGQEIYKAEDLDNDGEGPAYVNDSETEALLLGRLSNIWTQLPDGDYYLNVKNIVIDKVGKICYYDYYGVTRDPVDTPNKYGMYSPYGAFTNSFIVSWDNVDIPPAILKNMEKKVAAVFYNAHVTDPEKVNGKKVLFRYPGVLREWKVQVMGHSVSCIYCRYCPVMYENNQVINMPDPGLPVPVLKDSSLILALETIFHDDQVYRHRSKWDSIRYFDSVNLLKVELIIAKYGWPGPDLVGAKGSQAAFLVIQHANLKVQEKYLPMLRDAVKTKKAEPYSLAMLEDRVAMREGKKQVYGSQVLMDGEGSFLSPLEDPDNADKRRAEVGLGPLAEYVKHFGLEWNLEEYKKQLPALEKRLANMHFE